MAIFMAKPLGDTPKDKLIYLFVVLATVGTQVLVKVYPQLAPYGTFLPPAIASAAVILLWFSGRCQYALVDLIWAVLTGLGGGLLGSGIMKTIS